jgi:NAD(P)-dependent dehydrogenase (short-subunit alcohol dehydrogenase family)
MSEHDHREAPEAALESPDHREGLPQDPFGLTGFTQALADEGKEHGIRAIVLYPGAMATNWGAFSPEERQESEPNEASPTRVLPPEQVADLIV